MFVCTKCHRLADPGESSVVVVTATRAKTYPRRKDVFRMVNRDEESAHDRGGQGREATGSMRVCGLCAAVHNPG